MRFYADTAARRTRQVVADLLVVGWVIAWVLVGRAVHAAVAATAAPMRQAAAVGGSIEEGMGDAGRGVGGLPLVGDVLGAPFEEVAAAGDRLREAGTEAAALIETVAVWTGVLVALLPAAAVLLPWLWLRLRYARGAAEVRRLAASDAATDLLALRAVVSRRPGELTAVVPLPAAAWRAGDPHALARLAALEAGRWGVRTSVTSWSPGSPSPGAGAGR